MAIEQKLAYPRRIYPLDPRELTEEQLAVVFAMTSRRSEPFDEIAKVVSEEKAADFHERWVLNYGHASVAEHAIIHMAVENISRLACDDLEDNRLASYTEKSTRFQILEQGYYHLPQEIRGHPLEETFVSTCDHLFEEYRQMVDEVRACLRRETPQDEKERDSAYNLRIRRAAIDNCRFLLPAATLTNVGVTMNARTMEHAIRKLLSSDLEEEHEIGQELKDNGRQITPTLIKYADENDYLVLTRKSQREIAAANEGSAYGAKANISLVHWDSQAEEKLVAALLYRYSQLPYQEIWDKVCQMDSAQREEVLERALAHLGPHDIPVRELETVDYTFDMIMDYGAYREYKRHRMQTYIPQPLTVDLGYAVPPLIVQAGLRERFDGAMEKVDRAYREVAKELPRMAEYLVTHAHRRRVLSKLNLRECYQLFKLRTQPHAHFTIREVAYAALEPIRETHPLLVRYLQLRSQ